MKNILITGINGFVGSSLAEKELTNGNNVIGIIRDTNNKTQKDILKKCITKRGDVEDSRLIERVVSDYEIDVIYHLASLSIVRIADKNPINCYHSNILGTLNVLEAVRKIKPTIKVVVASSDKAYGTHDILPYTEDMQLKPDGPYATSKACADLISQSYFKTYNLNVNVIRCANIYGPRDMNLSRLIPNTMRNIINNTKPQIYSGVLNFKREFLFIEDVCNAYHLLSNEGVPGEIYNIGDNEFYTIEDVVKKISLLMGFNGGHEVIGKDFLEIPFQYMSAKKLKSLGWNKQHTFDMGLEKTISWYKRILS